jgi:hypothetical protein
MPPFALTDRTGTIQRYVEPVPGVELDSYVDQVVVVRHDTGRTLLASQLELPLRPMYPLLDESRRDSSPVSAPTASDSSRGRYPGAAKIATIQFVDDDDSSVQLVPDGESEPMSEPDHPEEPLPPGAGSAPGMPATPPAESHDGALAPTVEESGPDSLTDAADLGDDPLDAGASDWGELRPCPKCGGFHFGPGCEPEFGEPMGGPFFAGTPPLSRLFADVEINFLRTHLVDDAVGKLSEKYEFSPRLIVGFRDTGKLDGRFRYWDYGRDTRVLGDSPIRVEFRVLDLEGTHLFTGQRSDVLLASGLRLASIDLTDDDGDTAGADLLGITLAAEGRTRLCEFHDGQFAWVYGGRLSILGGDWGTEAGSDFVSAAQDDNVVVHEVHAGIDYAVCSHGVDFHARLGFEMQNWHSDVLSANSIGILGPGFQLGAEF